MTDILGRVVDLTAVLCVSTPAYPGDPAFSRTRRFTFEADGVNVSGIEMSAHSGSHVDLPLHYASRGADAASISCSRFIGSAIAIDAPKRAGENISPDDFAQMDIRADDIVLFRTGWEILSNTPAFFEGEWPGFAPEAAEALVFLGVKAVGGDFPSADSPRAIASGSPAHKTLLNAGVPIFECLVNLAEVVGKRFRFIGPPLKMDGAEGSPVRAVAILCD